MCRDVFYICKIFSNECSTCGNKTLKKKTRKKWRRAYKRAFLNFKNLSNSIRSSLPKDLSSQVIQMYPEHRIYMRVFRICVIMPIERVEKIRDGVHCRRRRTYRSVLSWHRYVIFVITTVTTVAAGGWGGAISFGRSTWRLSGITCAAQRAGGASRRFVKCTFSTCYRARRSAVKGRLPAMRSAFRLLRERSRARGNIRHRRLLNSRTKVLHTGPVITRRAPSRLNAQRTALLL